MPKVERKATRIRSVDRFGYSIELVRRARDNNVSPNRYRPNPTGRRTAMFVTANNH